ncbi:hypothetical protein BJV78DRAFT_388512 [Lactifluus subvellereus]|nr:hypothetical protein BJV78DRAFT_388512 [Lactifluus subvellereus]
MYSRLYAPNVFLKMIPLIPTIALAIFSLTCSAFVILRIVHSILPPRTLGRRVYPLNFNRPSSRSLPPADKSYIWLALCDISALAVFVWEAFSRWFHPLGAGMASNVGSASRLWLALTLRQTCFLVISALILIHLRLRKSVSFGFAHWLLWVPFALLATVSTIMAGIVAHTSRSFLIGYIVYSSTVAVLNTIMFGCLVGTLITIRRSLANFNKVKELHSHCETFYEPQTPLATEDVDAIREGSSWVTSPATSHHKSVSPFSYSTNRMHTTQSVLSSPEQTTPPRIPFWPPQGVHSSTSPRTPSTRRGDKDFEPFRRRAQSLRAAAATLGSGNSWITSSPGTHPTLSVWSYTASRPSPPDRLQDVVGSAIASTPTQDLSPTSARPVVVSARVLAGHRFAPSTPQVEKGNTSPAAARPLEVQISALRILACLAGVWLPLLLALPYFIFLNSSNLQSNESTSTILAVSVTISSPLLALNLLLRHPISFPDIFDVPPAPPSITRRAPSIGSTSTFADVHKRGSSTKQIATPTTNLWLVKGDAIDRKGYLERFLRVLVPSPKLSILPVGGAKRRTSVVPYQPTPNWKGTQHVKGAVATHLPSPPVPTKAAHRRHSFNHPHYIEVYQHSRDHTLVAR